MLAPYQIITRPKYIYAEEPAELAFRVVAEHGVEKLIADAEARARDYLAAVDELTK